jgi:hypothetical protein
VDILTVSNGGGVGLLEAISEEEEAMSMVLFLFASMG